MRLSKKRLAALAMSVVMAASTMSFPTYADELIEEVTVTESHDGAAMDELVEEGVELADQQSDAYVVDPASVKFHYADDKSNRVTYQLVSTTDPTKREDREGTAVVEKETAADCETPAYLWLQITIDGTTYHSGQTDDPTTAFVKESALGHNWMVLDNEGYVVDYPNCETDGSGYYYNVCTRCGKKTDTMILTKLEKENHKYGENQVRYEDLVNVEIVNGEPQLVDILKDGTYTKVTYHVCQRFDRRNNKVCGHEEVIDREAKTILAKKVTKTIVTDQEGLAAKEASWMNCLATEVLALDKIELANCLKDGKYQLTTYALNADGTLDVPVSQRWVTVPAHHMVTPVVIEFESAEDAAQCTVDKDNNVFNKSCWKKITYYEVVHCTAAGCPNKACDTDKYYCQTNGANQNPLPEVSRSDAKIAEPQGDHIINTESEAAVDREASKTYADYSVLDALAKTAGSYITLSENTATCTEDGTATVTFLCKICKAEVKKVTLNTQALGHDPQLPVEENVVAATCQSTGSYDAVIYCGRCNAELYRRPVIIPRLKHTNEITVTPSGVGTDDHTTDLTAYIKLIGNKVVDYDGEALRSVGKTLARPAYGGWGTLSYKSEYAIESQVYTNCTVCNQHEVSIDNYKSKMTVTIDDVQKQKKSGEAGSITLTFRYTKQDGKVAEATTTVPYFSTIEAYNGRVEDIPLNGLNKDDDGVYRYYVNGVFQSEFSGIVEYYGEEFFVANGVVATGANGLNMYDDVWYFLSKGQIARSYTGLAEYGGEWFYIVNGKLDTNVNGLVPYNGGMFVFAAGRLCKEVNGLWQDADGTWYFLALGQVATSYTGIATYGDGAFYVRNGKLATDMNTTITYEGKKYKVVDGAVYGPIA